MSEILSEDTLRFATLFLVRIVEAGWRGRRGGVDLMVAMNPETWKADLAEIEPGGYLLYDATRPLAADRTRADVTAIGVPLTALCHEAFSDPRQRQLFKNIAYLGSLAFLLSIDPAVVENMLVEQYKAKAPLLDANRIQYEATIEDPETFSAPWTIAMHLYRNTEPNAELLEFKCVEFSEHLLYNEFLKEPLP